MKPLLFSLALLLLLLAFSCTSPPDYPDEPVIAFVSLSKSTMLQATSSNSNVDETLLTLSFTDGDGDIGLPDNTGNPNIRDSTISIFLTDKRDNFSLPGFRIPFVGEQGVGKGISGELYINLTTTCCYFEDDRSACEKSTTGETDELVYEIYITDRAGNASNIIETPVITLLCQ